MTPMPVFFKRGDFPAMTAAERQRKCRANGKGKHRGGTRVTKASREALRVEFAALIAAAEAGEAALASAAAGACPAAAAPVPCPPTDAPIRLGAEAIPSVSDAFEWNLSAMAA